MAEQDKIMELVQKELDTNPDIEVRDLFEKVKKKEPSAKELSLRQFNARYPLQIKRRQSMGEAGGQAAGRRPQRRRRTRRAEPNREAVRESFLRFASELSAAEERKDLVQVLSKVDQYVDEVVKAARR